MATTTTAPSMNPWYRLGWSVCRAISTVYFRWRVCNLERVPLQGPVILAANHVSFADPPLIGASVHRAINYLARDSLFRNPIMGRLLRSWNVVPVNRDGRAAAGLKAIWDRLHAGGAIILFPEGTRSFNGLLQPAQPGIGLIIAKSSAPVVPVRLFGAFDAFGRNVRFPRPRQIVIKYGRPLLFEKLRAEAKACATARLKEIYQQIADQIMEAITALEPHTDMETFP